jgi:hypothetical protein
LISGNTQVVERFGSSLAHGFALVLVIEGGDQGFDSAPIADLSKRFSGRLAPAPELVMVLVSEDGHKGFDSARIADLSERPGGSRAIHLVLSLEDVDEGFHGASVTEPAKSDDGSQDRESVDEGLGSAPVAEPAKDLGGHPARKRGDEGLRCGLADHDDRVGGSRAHGEEGVPDGDDEERLHGAGVPYLPERLGGRPAHLYLFVSESGDQRPDGPSIAQLAERIGRSLAYMPVSLLPQDLGQLWDVSAGLESVDIWPSEQRHDVTPSSWFVGHEWS